MIDIQINRSDQFLTGLLPVFDWFDRFKAIVINAHISSLLSQPIDQRWLIAYDGKNNLVNTSHHHHVPTPTRPVKPTGDKYIQIKPPYLLLFLEKSLLSISFIFWAAPHGGRPSVWINIGQTAHSSHFNWGGGLDYFDRNSYLLICWVNIYFSWPIFSVIA